MAFSRPRSSSSSNRSNGSSRKGNNNNNKYNENLHINLRLRDRFEQLLKARNVDPATQVKALRQLVLLEGIPVESITEQTTWTTKCTLRGMIWKVLLGVNKVDAAQYII